MGKESHKAFSIKKIVVESKNGQKIVTIPKEADINGGDIVLIYLHIRKNDTSNSEKVSKKENVIPDTKNKVILNE